MVMAIESRADLDARNKELIGDVRRQIESTGIKQVRVATVDYLGVPRAKMVTADRFLNRSVERGHPWALPLLTVDAWQNLPENTGLGAEIGFGNGVIVPDLRSFHHLPWAPDTGIVLTDMFTAGGEPLEAPRQILATVLERASARGYSPVFGSECEFYIFKPVDESRPSNPGFAPLYGMQVWFTDQALGQALPLLDEIRSYLLALKVPIYEMFNEHGGGQYEFNLEPASGIDAIDSVVLMKIALKETCYRRGLRATFMGKITNDAEFPVSGYHLHQSLTDRSGSNAFADPAAQMGLSDAGRHFIGGVLAHASAMTAIAAPTVSAYKRFTPGTWAPTRASWGFDNRTAMLRVVPGVQGLNIENRLPSSEANPYLLAAAQTAAGLEGIEKSTEPCEPGTGNMLEDQRYPEVPTSMIEALDAFEKDPFMAEALGSEFARNYAALQRMIWKRFLSYVTDWEIQEYRDIL
jgi:glutamine synthetase